MTKKKCCLCNENKPVHVTIHKIPGDPKKRQLWIKSIKTKYPFFKPVETDVLCSKHFSPKYFLKCEAKTTLDKDAVPTIFDFFETTKKIRKPPLDRSPVVAGMLKNPIPSSTPEIGSISANTQVLQFLGTSDNEGNENRPVVPTCVRQDVRERALEILAKRNAKQASSTQKFITVPAITVLPGGGSQSILPVKDNPSIEVLPKNNQGVDENPLLVPLSVNPDVRERALQILAKRNTKKQSQNVTTTEDQPDLEIWPNSLVAKPKRKEDRPSKKLIVRSLNKEKALKASVKQKAYTIKLLKIKLKRLLKRVEILKNEKVKKDEESSVRLSESLPVHVKSLLTAMARGRKQKEYPPETRSFALALYKISPRAYSFVKQNFLDMLPIHTTLRRWRKEMQKGVIDESHYSPTVSLQETLTEQVVHEEVIVENFVDGAWEGANNIIIPH